jgi:hypothetical protein
MKKSKRVLGVLMMVSVLFGMSKVCFANGVETGNYNLTNEGGIKLDVAHPYEISGIFS